MQRAHHHFYSGPNQVIDAPARPATAILPTAAWFSPERCVYSRVDERAALLRLVGRVDAGFTTPRGVALAVDRGESVTRHPGAAAGVTGRRSRSHPMLWHATFELPLEIVEYPGALFTLTADRRVAVALPGPRLGDAVRANDELAMSRPWLPAHVRRHAVALAAGFAAAVAISPTAAAMASTTSASSQKTPPASASAPGSPAAGRQSCPDPTGSESGTSASAAQTSETSSSPSDSSTGTQDTSKCPPDGQTGSSGSSPAKPTKPASGHKPAQKHPPTASHGQSKPSKPKPPAQPSKAAAHPSKPAAHPSKPAAHHPTPAAQTGAKHSGHWTTTSASEQRTSHPGANRGAHASAGAASQASPAVLSPGTDPAVLDPYTASQVAHDESTGAALDQPPAWLVPIYKAAGQRYHIPWQILAAINSIETDYGQNLNISSAGAIGWMQFEPGTWQQYGVSVDGSGAPNPYDPVDAIYSAARYLAASGGAQNLGEAIFAYNHAQWYVDEVLLRAQLIGAHALGSATKSWSALAFDAKELRELARTDQDVDIEQAADGAASYTTTTGVVSAVASDRSEFWRNYPISPPPRDRSPASTFATPASPRRWLRSAST